MAKKSNVKIELGAGAWDRFERAVDKVAKSPPQHRTKQKSVPTLAKSGNQDSTRISKKGGRRPPKSG